MSKKSSLKVSEELNEYPEITREELARARFRVNLQNVPRKQRVNIMLDTGVIAFFKARAGDRGYQTLINETLKQAIHLEDIEKLIRRVLKEELAHCR